MKLTEFYQYAASRWDDELVVCSASSAGHEWYRTTESLDCLYLQSSMSLSPMVALGLASAVPAASVWNFDGDGALAMNLGCLLTEAEQTPPNMTHFVLVNREYAATSGLPYPGNTQVDFEAVARGCGIERAWTVRTLDEVAACWDDAVTKPEYGFVAVEIEPGPPIRPAFPMQSRELKYHFARHVEQLHNVQVFDTERY